MPSSSASPATAARNAAVAALRAAGCVFAEDEADLLLTAAGDASEVAGMVARRCAGEPLEHVVGWAEFCGLRIVVEPGVFVPRRRSALLVREAISRTRPGAAVVDLCCGSGAVGAAVAAAVDGIRLHAVDLDPVAVRCARRNVAAYGGEVAEGDLYRALPDRLRGAVDVVVANAPYVPTAGIPLLPAEARDHEPLLALDGGVDGLAVQRRIVDDAPRWLAPGGCLLIETSARDARALAGVVAARGLDAVVARSADLDAAVVIGTAISRDGRRARP